MGTKQILKHYVILYQRQHAVSSGRKPEDEGVEDNGLEENSGDGQEDVETSLENLQDMDMMDISVLDEADIDNGSVADCVEEEEEATLPEGLADSTELVEGDLKGLPEQLQEHAIDDKDTVNNVDTSSSDFTMLQVNCHMSQLYPQCSPRFSDTSCCLAALPTKVTYLDNKC